MRLALLALLSLTACAHTRSDFTEIGPSQYLVTCDGNGYATQNDALQCLARTAKDLCDKEGKRFEVVGANSKNDTDVKTNIFNGQPVLVGHPSASAQVRCTSAAH